MLVDESNLPVFERWLPLLVSHVKILVSVVSKSTVLHTALIGPWTSLVE